ncbi:MAG: DUF4870 domain-containing protein [Nocardioidaceae bacterium]
MTTGPQEPPPPYDPNQPGQQQGPPAQGWGQPAQPVWGQSGQPGQPPGYGAPPPPMGYQGGPPPLRPEDERLWAIAAHLGPIALGFVAPLVVWLVFKDRSPFLDRSAKESLNMQISYTVYGVVAGFSLLLLVGLVLLPLVGVMWFVFVIVGTVKAANHEDYRYPLIFRLVS